MKALPKILPGTGRGTTKWWRGRLKPISALSKLNPAQPNPSVATRHLPVPGRILGAKCTYFLSGFVASCDNFFSHKATKPQRMAVE